MKAINKILQAAGALSMEVLIAGLACLALALKIAGLPSRFVYYLIFGGCLWIIYTADHLLDSLRLQGAFARRSYRHVFHKKYFVPIAVLWAGVIGIEVYLIGSFLPVRSLLLGIFLGGLSFLHLFFSQHKGFRSYPKEFVVALVFTCGVWLLPFSLQENIQLFLKRNFTWKEAGGVFLELWPLGLAFWAMLLSAYSNLLMLAIFERKEDRLSGFSSEVLSGGLRLSLCKIYANAVLVFFLALLYFLRKDGLTALLFLVTGGWPLVSLRFFRSLKGRGMYRFFGDMVFWLYFLPLLV